MVLMTGNSKILAPLSPSKNHMRWV